MKYSHVYILDCGSYTGGGEALHQLGCDLIDLGYKVSMVRRIGAICCPTPKMEKYYHHGLESISFDEIVDDEINLLVVPETATYELYRVKNITKMVWWLSYTYYDGHIWWNSALSFRRMISEGLPRNLKHLLKRCLYKLKYNSSSYPLENVINVAGSNYALNLLNKKMHIRAHVLFHSIGVDFLDAGMYTEKSGRKDVVLYNPAKQSRIMDKLLKRHKFEFIPIANLNCEQMINLFRQSKLYIDFGNFPGPERLPKETVFNGVNLLVWYHNAAQTDDVLIPNKYKVSEKASISNIEEFIGKMLINYDADFNDFSAFRFYIANMENQYYKDLQTLF